MSVIFLVFVALTACNQHHGNAAQSSSPVGDGNTQKQQQTASSMFVVRVEGWPIPALGQSVAAPRKEIRPSVIFKADEHLYSTILKPKEGVITDNYFTAEERTALALRPDFEIMVNQISRYDLNGKVFCYEVRVSRVGVKGEGQKKRITPFADLLLLDYYDLDGDGKFESVKWGNFSALPQTPDWVRQK